MNDVNDEKQIMLSNNIEQNKKEINIIDGELFAYNLSPECNKTMKQKAQQCAIPVLSLWQNIRNHRPILANVCFFFFFFQYYKLNCFLKDSCGSEHFVS